MTHLVLNLPTWTASRASLPGNRRRPKWHSGWAREWFVCFGWGRCYCFVACCCFVALLFVIVCVLALRLLAHSCCYCMTAGRGATKVYWMLRPGAGSVSHCQPAARGLLSLISLLRAFFTKRSLIKRNTRPIPGQITDLAARPQHESGDPHPRFDAPPESLGWTMRFHRRGIHAHAAPRSLRSISRTSTPLRVLSTRKLAELFDIGNETSVPEFP